MPFALNDGWLGDPSIVPVVFLGAIAIVEMSVELPAIAEVQAGR